ncbi:MAG: DUF308 domain-containing protein [Bacteroidales bacterium]|jgi:uncharacterized membrane protein HdeD (DUF308 family)|nr:DUF308 domain-containing protein [Bacteroidales bacterium]MCI2121932.1 DUF308 domain-containing protein [Bacteroidales bacterium]MCI2145463.1 DUF308 domain-containing protein [Bacteroidales bacterium]
MKNTIFSGTVEKASKTVKNWWLLLAAGIILTGMGIATFFFPGESMNILSILLGIVILTGGIIQLILAITTGNYFLTRGYIVVGGILSVILGLIFCFESRTMADSIFPVLMALWMLYESFMILGMGNELAIFGIRGSGWAIFGGVLMMSVSILALISPFAFGKTLLAVFVGTALIIDGIYAILGSLLLKDIENTLSEAKKSLSNENPVEDAKIVE